MNKSNVIELAVSNSRSKSTLASISGRVEIQTF